MSPSTGSSTIAVIAGIADVAVDGDGIRGDSLERETGLEERSVEIVHATTGSVAVQLAHAKQQLAREPRVGQLHGGQGPHERFPVAHRDAAPCQGARVRTR